MFDVTEMILAMHMPEMTPEVIALHEQIEQAKEAGTLNNALLIQCTNDECILCGAIVCPHGEPLHFHHDGCPACDAP
jgi:hypothetical protein